MELDIISQITIRIGALYAMCISILRRPYQAVIM